MSVFVERIGSRVFIVSGKNANNHKLGTVAREAKWNAGYRYDTPMVLVNTKNVAGVSSRTYVVVPADTPNYGTALRAAARRVLSQV